MKPWQQLPRHFEASSSRLRQRGSTDLVKCRSDQVQGAPKAFDTGEVTSETALSRISSERLRKPLQKNRVFMRFTSFWPKV